MARAELDGLLRTIVEDVSAHVEEALGPVDASRVLIVAAAARRDARATVRGFAAGARWDAPRVHVGGVEQLYEIALRPRWFRATTPEGRLLTLIHELWHLGPRFDGTLAPERAHHGGTDVARAVREVAEAWRSRSPRADALGEALGARGERTLAAWSCRPPSRIPPRSAIRRDYDERDLYPAIVELL